MYYANTLVELFMYNCKISILYITPIIVVLFFLDVIMLFMLYEILA